MKRAASEEITSIKSTKYAKITNCNIPPEWYMYEKRLNAANLMYPILIVDDSTAKISIQPDLYAYGTGQLIEMLTPLVANGLHSVFLYGLLRLLEKDAYGRNADSDFSPIIQALKIIRQHFPTLLIACDVSLHPYTSHGYGGILDKNGSVNRKLTISRIADIALRYARAGANIVAPSIRLCGTIEKISKLLCHNELLNTVTILSYTIKQPSVFYGLLDGEILNPIRHNPELDDAKPYFTTPPNPITSAILMAQRGMEEGASMITVKPGTLHLGTVHRVKKYFQDFPVLVHDASGIHAMLRLATKIDWFNLENAAIEAVVSMKRAGASCVITSLTPIILNILNKTGGTLK